MNTSLGPKDSVHNLDGRSKDERPSGDLSELSDPADFHPLHHENVPGMVETRGVRRHKLAWNECGAVEQSHFAEIIGALAEMRDDRILAVENADPSFQFGHDHEFASYVEMAGVTQAWNEADMLPVQGKCLNTIIPAVSHG